MKSHVSYATRETIIFLIFFTVLFYENCSNTTDLFKQITQHQNFEKNGEHDKFPRQFDENDFEVEKSMFIDFMIVWSKIFL